MSGKRVAGHERTAVPLSITCARQSPKDGWRIDCKCGWSAGPFPRRAEADSAYSQHIVSALPVCGGCGQSKAKSSMSKGSPHRCKACAAVAMAAWIKANPSEYERSKRRSHLKKKYGITPDEFDQMLKAQGGLCAICCGDPGDARGYRPHVDHCHSTGVVRGILCGRCNKGLGALRDDPNVLMRAYHYLTNNRTEVV